MPQFLQESSDTALAVSEKNCWMEFAKLIVSRAFLVAPEGETMRVDIRQLLAQGWVAPDEHLLLLNTKNEQKYCGII